MYSGIPQPASAMKRPSSGAGRMSMAPPRTGGVGGLLGRPSMGGTIGESGSLTAKRNSVRKSFLPGSQPPPSTTRRSSQYGRASMAGQSGASFFTTTKNSVQKDPRPLKDTNFKRKMQAEIQEYLLENNFEMEMKYTLGINALVSPTQKDFYQIFQWLYMRLDPNYQFAPTKPEAEVMPLLQYLRYPYSSVITKTQLTAVGSANTWPTMLGMLYWMVGLAQVTDQYRSGDLDRIAEDEGHGIGTARIVFNYMAKCYNAWLNEIDDHEEFEQEMLQAFDERDAGLNDQLKTLQEENQAYKAELQKLTVEMQPLQQAKEQRSVLEVDIKKFAQYIELLENKSIKLKDQIEKVRQEVEASSQELEKAKNEEAILQAQVDAQGLSPADIDRMNTEREKLNQGIQQVASKLEESQRKLDEQELGAAQELDTLEHAVSRYNQLAYAIGITPASAPHAKGRDFELQILPLVRDVEDESNKLLLDSRTGYQPAQVLNADIRNFIKPFLENLRRDVGTDIHNTMDDSIKMSEYIDRIAEALADKKDELETLEAKVQGANNEYQELKETMQEEINISNSEMEKQAANLKAMRVGMNKGRLEAEQKLQGTCIEYDELHQAHNFQREKLHSETQKIVSDVIDFKIHIQKSLEDYELRCEDALAEDGSMP
ncbi:HEC/Ndc80p family-domain-containing protein [Sphaerosporella brunnea]|uniref:Kinetochore protein NDC80 n=1 Tax=Sphaerosporella brunnea TaxID=1250544 RepID=A0A5J5FAT4_9PEZI|nr:HEC/Ndc80p family-domain-containing protein [Sphaerosporella brunnea]